MSTRACALEPAQRCLHFAGFVRYNSPIMISLEKRIHLERRNRPPNEVRVALCHTSLKLKYFKITSYIAGAIGKKIA